MNINDDYLKCPICLEISDDAVETVCCGNIFCSNCIKLESKCPLCRDSNFRFTPNISLRRIIDNIQVECKNDNCSFKTTFKNMKEHYKECDYNVCKFLSHKNEILNNFVSNNDRLSVKKNNNGDISKLGNTGKYYCGKKVLNCRCCNGYCGPTNGDNCESCQYLDIQNRKLDIVTYFVNKDGFPSRKSKETNTWYCGRKMKELNISYCDGYCGPNNRPNCNACQSLQNNIKILYPNLLIIKYC